jgi:hypothetical protein
MKRLRLVKVDLQATFVVDDGDTLEERTANPVTLTAAEWPVYAKTGFAKAIKQAEEELNASDEEPAK